MSNENLLDSTHLVLCGDLSGEEIQKRGDICTRVANAPCYTVETDTAGWSNNTPIFKKKGFSQSSRYNSKNKYKTRKIGGKEIKLSNYELRWTMYQEMMLAVNQL